MTKSPAIIFLFLWHARWVRWQVFGAPRQLTSFMNSTIEFRTQQVTRGSHHLFFKDCRSSFKNVMQPVLSERFPLWPLLTNMLLHVCRLGFIFFIFLFILFLTMILSFFIYSRRVQGFKKIKNKLQILIGFPLPQATNGNWLFFISSFLLCYKKAMLLAF